MSSIPGRGIGVGKNASHTTVGVCCKTHGLTIKCADWAIADKKSSRWASVVAQGKNTSLPFSLGNIHLGHWASSVFSCITCYVKTCILLSFFSRPLKLRVQAVQINTWPLSIASLSVSERTQTPIQYNCLQPVKQFIKPNISQGSKFKTHLPS